MLRKSSAVRLLAGVMLVTPLLACATPQLAGESEALAGAAGPTRHGPCVSDSPDGCSAKFPRELMGVWEGGSSTCVLPGNTDSDVRFEIKRDRLLGYEHWNQLLDIKPIGGLPIAWKVASTLYIDEQAYEHHEIYVLHGAQPDRLTIIDDSRSAAYARCK